LREATLFGLHSKHLILDNDSKYGEAFARVARTTGIDVVRTAYRASKKNAICERFLRRLTAPKNRRPLCPNHAQGTAPFSSPSRLTPSKVVPAKINADQAASKGAMVTEKPSCSRWRT
jgi:hypothetical protein